MDLSPINFSPFFNTVIQSTSTTWYPQAATTALSALQGAATSEYSDYNVLDSFRIFLSRRV